MADGEEIKQAIGQAAVEVTALAKSASEATRHKTGSSPTQQVFKWTAKDKYLELHNFEMEASNTFLTKHYDINDDEKFP